MGEAEKAGVRIKHWVQDTVESGRWEWTRLLPRELAQKLIDENIFESATIEEDEYFI